MALPLPRLAGRRPPKLAPGPDHPAADRAAAAADRPASDRAATDARIERLSSVSAKRVVEPDEAVPGGVGDGELLPRELLTLYGLDGIDLTDEQWVTLSREEVASITANGIRFEAVLLAGFALEIVRRRDLTDPRVTYILHELGEETRHSRLFVRLLSQIKPAARNPLDGPVFARIQRMVLPRLLRQPAFFDVLVLTGEEIPDLFQKLASEHPDTDPFVREVNRYHRMEEARHLNFARMVLPEFWAEASGGERWRIKHLAPRLIGGMFDTFIHPGVYETVGLPGWETWQRVRRSPRRVALRHEALRPLLAALIHAGAFTPGRVPTAWQELCGVDRHGTATSPTFSELARPKRLAEPV